nr:hypothetical protein [Tanacetum cinerariifolium]
MRIGTKLVDLKLKVGEIRGSSVIVVEWAGKEEVRCKRVGEKTGYWCYSTSFQNGREEDTVTGLGTLHG